MPYTIDEGNAGRQRLLAHILNRYTEPHLASLVPARPGRWLDVGSGLGETTKMLARFMALDGECVGLEGDPALIEIARSRDWAGRRVSFQQGDANELPFSDGTFDFVFTRYLLVHLPDPVKAIGEMLRVTKQGGAVFAQEPDLEFACCHPPNLAYERIGRMWSAAFPNAQIGRKLVHFFREAGADAPQARADMLMEHDGVDLKRTYSLTFEAIGEALQTAGALSKAEFRSLLNEFHRVEEDPSIVVLGHPLVAVWTYV